MKKEIILCILFFLILKAFTQSKINNYELGYYFDINHQRIDGYYDIDYKPKLRLDVPYTIGADFTPGYYYTLNGEKKSGYLKYSEYNTFFEFKSDNDTETFIIKKYFTIDEVGGFYDDIRSKTKTITPEECLGYVIGLDSFTVIENFDIQRQLGAFHIDKKEFAEVIEQVDNLTFYKHIKAGSNNIVTTYLVKTDSSSNYISFSKGIGKFKETAIMFFKDFKIILDLIGSGRYFVENIPEMAKMLKFKHKYENKEKVFFNVSWDEIDNENKSLFYAIIDSIVDTTFYFKYYYKNGTPIYKGQLTSFCPVVKNGEFTWYYPDGNIRKKVTYDNNIKQDTIKTYFQNGIVHYEYEIINNIPMYSKVLNSNGENILDDLGNGKEIFYDSIAGREIIREFINNKIFLSYYLDSTGRPIYQFCKKNAFPKAFKTWQTKINHIIDYPINSIRKYNHGIALIRCIVDSFGNTSNIEIIKSIDKDCDSTLIEFISFIKTNKRWKPAKVNNKKVAQEIIIPINFSIKGFLRSRGNNYYYIPFNYNMMMQQQMMQSMPYNRF